MENYFRELKDLTDDEFLDEADKNLFLEYLNDPSMVIMEMANFVGNHIAVEKRLPFSFHICDKIAVHGQHAIRAKILWNPSKAPSDADGYLELHGDYNYVSGSHKYKPSEKELSTARYFFKKYKVLFAAVWERFLDADPLQDYMKGYLSWKDLLTKFDLGGKQYYLINHAKNLSELEKIVRENNIFNMND